MIRRLRAALSSISRRSRASKRPPGWSSPDLIIVGLGNPGPEYRDTRHNAGVWCLEVLARRARARLTRLDPRVSAAETYLAGFPVVLAQSRTFMNNSGQAVGYLLRRYETGAGRIIVLVDDMDLTPGKIRIRSTGSAGGHNGLKSVIGTIGTGEFIRIRIGVGRPASRGNEIDHVLAPLGPEERQQVLQAVSKAADSVETILRDGVEDAMNRFN
ncbi:MAG: aminoacyl-tRNA hydrolase [Chloroflexi bacterium]|nr:aminoacyl-tRNA hydrolase [Chloroflexota bacterium]